MTDLDVAALLTEVTSESPGGEDVEYDREFLELEQAINGKPEVQYGETVVASTPPDWKIAGALALSLMSRSRDIRVAVYLTRARLMRDGIEGLADGLALLEGLIEQRWACLYPQLDHDDGDDPTERVSALAALVEQTGMLLALRDAPLVQSRTHREFSLRDIQYASGTLTPPAGVEVVGLVSMENALAEGRDRALSTLAALEAAHRSTASIETLLTGHVGVAHAIDLSPLSELLQQAADFLRERLRDSATQSTDARGQTDLDTTAVASGIAPTAVSFAMQGEVSSRQDVIKVIDKVCAYYQRHEPSSPVPMLLNRARRLVDKNFMEILQDLAPDGLGQARQIGGEAEE
jgi:type VI secretion system protein ImpA